eukprot:gene40114-49613_t
MADKDGNEEGSAIVPDARIAELTQFYVSGLVSETNVIIEQLKSSEILTDENRGKWALRQLENAARSLSVYPFICPTEKGGLEIPEIEAQDAYIKIFLEVKSVLMKELEATFSVRKRHRDKLLVSVEDNEILQEEWETLVVEPATSTDKEAVEAYEARLQEKEDSISNQKIVVEREFGKWKAVQGELQSDQQKVEDWHEASRLKAIKQHRADTDALMRLNKALGILKKFLQGLMVNVPCIIGAVRKMDINGVDPYENSDMRKCYSNLTEQYRKSDELGVATTMMAGMKLHQNSNQSLRVFVRKVEEFHEMLKLLGVKVVTIADLVAMVAIGGMVEKHRVAFLQSESALALTLSSMEDESVLADGELSESGVSRRGAVKRSLLSKVLAFVDSEETRDLLATNFGKSGQVGSAVKEQTAAERKLALENQRVLAVYESNKECWRWVLEGRCKFGPKCRFKESHTAALMPKKVSKEKSSLEDKPVSSVTSSASAVSEKTTNKKVQMSSSSAASAVFGQNIDADAQWSGFEYESDVEDEDM